VLLLGVWWAWVYTCWFTNWFDPNQLPVRLMLVAVMGGSLVMSAAIPDAFGESGWQFAGAYVAIQVGRTGWAALALGPRHELTPNLRRVTAWAVISGVAWRLGAAVEGDTRLAVWAAGSVEATLAVVVASLGSVGLWWIYFDRGAVRGRRAIASAEDPGRLARSAYTLIHVVMVAGIIGAAAADEATIAHPGDGVSIATAAVIVGGPLIYLMGTAFFNRALAGAFQGSRAVALVVLLVLALFAGAVSALVLSALVLAVVVGVALSDLRARPVGPAPAAP
jgi:low temperature requirement protein LtrA